MLTTLRNRLLDSPRSWKRAMLVAFDLVALTGAIWASFALRFDRWNTPMTPDEALIFLSAPFIAMPIFVRMGLYRSVVRYLPERAAWKMLQAVTLAVLVWIFLAFFFEVLGRGAIPRSVPIIYWILASVVVIGSRLAAKWLLWPGERPTRSQRPAVVIYGAGEAGRQAATSLRSSYRIVGFLDDNADIQGREIAGYHVYPPSQLWTLIRDYGVKHAILSIPSLPAVRRKEIVAELNKQSLKVLWLPGIADLVTGKYSISQIREVEVDDLLGRSSIPPDTELISSMIVGRSIMVTGAGGSIGSELCRKIVHWRPQRIVLFEANEFALYRIDKELSQFRDISVVPVLASVTNERQVEMAIREHNVDVLFHAAAHKHVPLVEANVLEGIRNNVLGTKTVANAALKTGVKDFVLISTDKAVRPTNVMGATKRWAELIVNQTAVEANELGTGQRFCAVRFGNVLGSNGSVVPLFKEQIAHGGPLTLTDPAMTRYFMSIQEAAELIVQAGALSEGGDVFLLDMGEPILISDLAENMIRLAGLTVKSTDNPGGDIEIATVGARPGEKLFEELFYDESSAMRTQHPKILRGKAHLTDDTLSAVDLERLKACLETEDVAKARSVLFEVITPSNRTR